MAIVFTGATFFTWLRARAHRFAPINLKVNDIIMKNTTSLQKLTLRRTASQKAQRGMSTVQLATGILVGVIALAGSFAGFQYINQAKTNQELIMLGDLKTAVTRYGATLAGTGFTATTATMSILNSLGFFSGSGWTVGGTTAIPTVANQFGGTLTLAAVTNTESLTFTYTNLPSSVCRDLAIRLDPLATVITATPANTGGADSLVKTAGGTLNQANAITGCAGTGNNNRLAFTFNRNS
jgi:hypothetical protein